MCCSSRDLEASPPLCVPIDKCDSVVLEKPIPLIAQIRDCEARWAQEMEDEVSENQKADARDLAGWLGRQCILVLSILCRGDAETCVVAAE